MSRTVSSALNLLVLSLLVGLSVLVFDGLPQEIPVHFGADGTPDRFASTSWLSWMLLPLMAVALSVMMEGISRLLPRMPEQLNVPDQKAYKALSLTDKLEVIARQQDFLSEITLSMNVMFAAIQIGSYQVAMGSAESLPWYSLASIAGFMIYTIIVAVRAFRDSQALINRLSEVAHAV
ncbi:MAG: DUF1648 domain-containing protein [Rhodothermales bacterium]|nr:DUF1648 domain-containing protein [Rhodothermales bacterium]